MFFSFYFRKLLPMAHWHRSRLTILVQKMIAVQHGSIGAPDGTSGWPGIGADGAGQAPTAATARADGRPGSGCGRWLQPRAPTALAGDGLVPARVAPRGCLPRLPRSVFQAHPAATKILLLAFLQALAGAFPDHAPTVVAE